MRTTLLRSFVFAICWVLIGCAGSASCSLSAQVKKSGAKTVQTLTAPNDALHFFVVGDWGRNGQFNQREVAHQMAQTALRVEPEFIINVGDNFYPSGVASVDDPLWLSSFENIYTDHALFCSWYSVLGNHDYRGNAQAQVDYTQKSRRWYMPQRYYTIKKKLTATDSVEFVFIDTPPFITKYYEDDEKYGVVGQDTARQWRWIDSVLATSKAQWKIVIGHHHMFTGGKRKKEETTLQKRLVPLMEKYGVQAYFNGHEHDLQVIKRADGPITYFVSGAGSESRPSGATEGTQFSAGTSGFMAMSLTPSALHVSVIDYRGSVLYQTVVNRK